MATYSTNLALTLMATGEQSNTWGDTTNTNLGTLLEQGISGYVTQAITDGSSANTTITIPNGATGVARNMFIEMTGALTFSTTSLIVPANKKMYFIFNNTSGGFAVTVKVSGQTGILVPNGKKVVLTCNGTDIVEAHTAIVGNATMGGTLGVTGATTLSSTLGVTGVATLGNGAILGTPASGTVTNLTGTASININGTVGATTPAAGAFTTLSATGTATLGTGLASYALGGGSAASAGLTDKDVTLRAWSVTSGTNEYSGDLILQSGVGTGNTSGKEGSVIIKAGNGGVTPTTLGALTTIGTFSSTGLAVTGTLSATSTISTSNASGVEITNTQNSRSSRLGSYYVTVAGEDAYFGTTTAAKTTTIQAGASAAIGVFSSTGLAVTGTLSATGFVGIGVAASVSNALEVAGDIRLQGGNNSYKFNNGLVEFKLSQDAGATAAASLNANFSVTGSLSKGSGSFRISHPLPTLNETHNLVHSFIEGPQADLIYRGQVALVAGKATVNIDTAATMTEGTFELLCRDVQCFTSNETDWNHVRGSVVGNILTIECQDIASIATISWMVIGERKDQHMLDTEWTDDDGKVIVEPLKLISLVNIASPQEENDGI